MDTLVITPNRLTIGAYTMTFDGFPGEPSGALTVPINYPVWLTANISGTRTVSGDASALYPKIGFEFGGIEWDVTCAIPGANDDPDTPVPLTPKTYIDSYNRLHIGDEVEVGMVLTINARMVSPNPSGAGYALDAYGAITVTFTNANNFGNNNNAERQPYTAYFKFDPPTPASGAGIGGH